MNNFASIAEERRIKNLLQSRDTSWLKEKLENMMDSNNPIIPIIKEILDKRNITTKQKELDK